MLFNYQTTLNFQTSDVPCTLGVPVDQQSIQGRSLTKCKQYSLLFRQTEYRLHRNNFLRLWFILYNSIWQPPCDRVSFEMCRTLIEFCV